MATQDCAHEDCDCTVEEGQGVTRRDETYCSSYCAKEGSNSSEECQCGHTDCAWAVSRFFKRGAL